MANQPKGGHWDAKDHAYEYPTKQPGTHWDAKDHAWEGPKQKGPGQSAVKRRAGKKKTPPPFQKKS